MRDDRAIIQAGALPPTGEIVNAAIPADLKRELVARAQAIGFDLCRVTRAETPPHVDEFRAWQQAGAAGEMEWMQRGEEKRCNPALVLPDARSVIVFGMNYWQGHQPKGRRSTSAGAAPMPRSDSGRIARYAWGDDYHDVMLAKLRELDALLSERGGVQKCYVDTGPVLERDFAAEAGIGWQGKSTMLVNQKLGTWFFLAEILTSLELPPDPPQPSRCGTCTRCITACPTGAITEPHRLDARRCISYLTIELKGSIPLEFRSLIGGRIYGCDTCLDVCPWNRFAAEARETSFALRPEIAAMKLRDFLSLDDEQFRTMFRDSPIKRIKRRGFLRNVCVALGNVGTREDLPHLTEAAKDSEPLIAEHAAWAIDRIEERLAAGARTAFHAA